MNSYRTFQQGIKAELTSIRKTYGVKRIRHSVNNFDGFIIHTCKREVPVVNIICEIGGGIVPVSFCICKYCNKKLMTAKEMEAALLNGYPVQHKSWAPGYYIYIPPNSQIIYDHNGNIFGHLNTVIWEHKTGYSIFIK